MGFLGKLLVRGALVGGAVAASKAIADKRGKDFRPVMAAIDLLPEKQRAAARKQVFKGLYEGVSKGSGDNLKNSFMNYGYCAVEPPHETIDLPAELEDDRTGMQLYYRVASAVDTTGQDLLEVGSGRGGGANFIFERLKPATYVGVDLAPTAVERANAEYGKPGLSYEAGDAENLRFADASFDAVLNVESCHCYPNVPAFLSEVFRVLRPGGHLLITDLRGAADVDEFRQQILDAGFQIGVEEDITANVVKALEIDSPRREAMLEEIPRPARRFSAHFAAVKGSDVFNQFSSREMYYLRFVARKP